MVLAILNSDPSLRGAEIFSPEKLFVAPQKLKRRSRAHNIPGGIKHLLSDSKRRRRVSVRSAALPSSSAPPPSAHRSHRLTRLRHKVTSPTAQQTLFATTTPASECQCPHSQSQPSSHAPVPINVTFPRRLPELPRKQISSDVLASLGFTPDVPSQYIRDRMERLGPMYAFSLFYSTFPLVTYCTLVCTRLCGPPRLLPLGQRYPRLSLSTSMGKLQQQCLLLIWRPSTLLPRLVRSHRAS
jgi:hypothetical protein